MFLATGTFSLGGIRYGLVRKGNASSVAGRALSVWEAQRVLSDAMRSAEAQAVREAYARFSEGSAMLHRLSNEEVLQQLKRMLEHPWMASSLVLVALSGERAARATAAPAPSRNMETDALMKSVSARLPSELMLAGHAYLVLPRPALATHMSESFELLSPEETQRALGALAGDAQRPADVRALLQQAAEAAAAARASRQEPPIAVLRQKRAYAAREVESSPAQTPSQLRKQRATDWLEIVFLSDGGEPMANQTYEVRLADGSTQRGSLDANGMAMLQGIVPGSCQVSFPDFLPKLAG